MRTIKFSIDDKEYFIIKHNAKVRGLSVSQFVKTCVFSYISKYPAKGTFHDKLIESYSDFQKSLL